MKTVGPLKPIVKSAFIDQRNDRSHELLVCVPVSISGEKPAIKKMFIRADQIERIVELDDKYSAYLLNDGLVVPVEGSIAKVRKIAFGQPGENGYIDLTLVTDTAARYAPNVILLNGRVAVRNAPEPENENDYTIGLWVHDETCGRHQFVEIKRSEIIDIYQMPNNADRTCIFMSNQGWKYQQPHKFYGTKRFYCAAIKPTELIDRMSNAEVERLEYLDLTRKTSRDLANSNVIRTNREKVKPAPAKR